MPPARPLLPLDFPYAEAKRIYAKAVSGLDIPDELPMGEAAFRAALARMDRGFAKLGGANKGFQDLMEWFNHAIQEILSVNCMDDWAQSPSIFVGSAG